jgi:hypothetical protein
LAAEALANISLNVTLSYITAGAPAFYNPPLPWRQQQQNAGRY